MTDANCLQDLGGDRTNGSASYPFHFILISSRSPLRCAVFSYLALYQSKRNFDLFIAASVCMAPMALSSMGAVIIKVRLMRRRILQRRAAARATAAHASRRLTPAARRAALRMLVGRFVLQHDQLNFDERKGENDRHRHESYAYMIGILCEVRPTHVVRRVALDAVCLAVCSASCARCFVLPCFIVCVAKTRSVCWTSYARCDATWCVLV